MTVATEHAERFTLLLPAPGIEASTLADDEIVVDPDEGATTARTDEDGAG